MPNGKPGYHPLTDILFHRLDVYGRETDDLIRQISQLRRELDEWWSREVGWLRRPSFLWRALARWRARIRLRELQHRAKQDGYDTP
jgi:hypothetical protein